MPGVRYFLGLALSLFVLLPLRGADDSIPQAEQILQRAGLATDDRALLTFFRERTISLDPHDVARFINELGSPTFARREAASRALIALGVRVTPFLEAARRSPDPEVRRRIEDCLTSIDRDRHPELIKAAATVLAARNPEGAARVLLAFLPSSITEDVASVVRSALYKVALREGKLIPEVPRALKDREPARRAGAGVALCRPQLVQYRASVRELLKDPVPTVRLAVGLALLREGEKEALPVLIALFSKMSRDHLWQIEDILYELAGDRAPTLALGNENETREAFVRAWLEWWKKEGSRVDLARVGDTSFKDQTLLALLDEGKILQLDSNDKPIFTIEKVGFPLDVQFLPGERVLLAEHGANQVTERARDGTILWEHEVASPLVAQRLANGRTFIATKRYLLEVDREGREHFRYQRPDGEEFMRASKLPSGELVVVTMRQQLVRIDTQGKDVFTLRVNVHTSGGRIQVQPNGNMLIPQMYHNRVVEYDSKGKVVREFPVEQPIAAVRLPNGHTLITSMSQMRAIEFDLLGKEIWEYKATTRVTRALRR